MAFYYVMNQVLLPVHHALTTTAKPAVKSLAEKLFQIKRWDPYLLYTYIITQPDIVHVILVASRYIFKGTMTQPTHATLLDINYYINVLVMIQTSLR